MNRLSCEGLPCEMIAEPRKEYYRTSFNASKEKGAEMHIITRLSVFDS